MDELSVDPRYSPSEPIAAPPQSPANLYGFAQMGSASRIKRVEQAVQFKRRGQISPLISTAAARAKFRTVASSQLNRDGTIIFPTPPDTASSTTFIGEISEGQVTNLLSDLSDRELTAHKGAASGYASLDGSALVPIGQIPAIPESQVTNLTTDLAAKEDVANKGIASGYASLDGSALVPVAQIPALPESQITNLTTDLAAKEDAANKGVANGYAELDSSVLVPVAQIPPLPYTAAPVTAPATSSDPGNAGEWAYDSSYIYVCVASATWMRAAIVTF